MADITLDTSFKYSAYSPVCTLCKHLNREGGRTCAAFPDAIPAEIWTGDNRHRESYPGDHGIQFEYADDVSESVKSKEP